MSDPTDAEWSAAGFGDVARKPYKLAFTASDGFYHVIAVQPYLADADPDAGTKGHGYSIEGQFTLGDLGALAELLRKHEAPGIDAADWARIQADGRRTLEVE